MAIALDALFDEDAADRQEADGGGEGEDALHGRDYYRRNLRAYPGSNPPEARFSAGATMAAGPSVKPLRVLTWTDAAGADWALVQQCATGDEDAVHAARERPPTDGLSTGLPSAR